MTMIRSYDDCARIWTTSKKRKIDNNTYLECEPHPEFPADASLNTYHIKLHATRIITYYPHGFTLNSGGWRTSTTKARMNEYSPAQIWQGKGLWTVHWNGGAYPYADGISFHDSGTVTGAGEDPKAEIKLRKRVNDFVAGYMDAFANGTVPPPSGGDCWLCLMKDKHGKPVLDTDTEHLLSHMDEMYYVPSLLVNAMGDWAGQCTSQAAREYVAYVWNGGDQKIATYLKGIAVPQLKKVLFDYMAHRLGMTPGRTRY